MVDRRVARPLLILCPLVALAVAAPFVVPPTKYVTESDYYCRWCGARLHSRETGNLGSTRPTSRQKTPRDSPLSAWYKKHVATDCPHDWMFVRLDKRKYVSFWGYRLREAARLTDSRPEPALVELPEADRAALERLLPQGRQACDRYIRKRLYRD